MNHDHSTSRYTQKKGISKYHYLKKMDPEMDTSKMRVLLSGDNLFSALKTSRSFSNSDLGHLQHSSDSNHLRVLETLWSTSYSKPLPAVPNTTAYSLHSNPSVG